MAGNLKFDVPPLPLDRGDLETLRQRIDNRPVLLAASTHPGEEMMVLEAAAMIRDQVAELLTILVPRHPERRRDIATALTRDSYRFALRSEGREPDRDTDLYIADTLGEMGLFLRLADVVVMGGSFSAALERPPVGGHNPLEPARLGKPAVTGPDMSNWAAVTDALVEAGGLAVIDAPWDLPSVLAPLLADAAAARAMGERGRRAAAEAGAGLDRLWDNLAPLLPPAPLPRSLARGPR